MNKNKICEALYALPGQVVVKRRKPLSVPVALFAAGAVLIVLNNLYGAELTNNLRSSVVFIGGALVVAGLIMLSVRVFGDHGVPFHRGGRCYLRYEELYFDRKVRNEVMQRVGEGGVQRLLEMEHARVPAVAVALYHTPDNSFAAMQAFEYADLEYKPLTELQVVDR